MKSDYFKRLNYTIKTIPAVPAPSVFFSTESHTARFMPIDQFTAGLSSEQEQELFNFEKSFRERHCGLGKKLISDAAAQQNSGFYLKMEPDSADQEQTAFIRYCLDPEHPVLYDKSYIEVADHTSACIILYFDTDDTQSAAEYYRNGLLHISIGKYAKAEILKIHNFADTAVSFETVRMDVKEKAHVTVHDIHLGSCKSGASYSSYIQEDWAEVHIYPLYFVDKCRRADIEHNLVINGKNTIADITARGAVKNDAHKIFRGNIFLNRGCSKSAARFSDNSIMLDKRAIGVSIPTIFCDEDDVVGEHAASFLAIDKEKLYYLMSRGFDELSAKKLLIESAFRPVFNRIHNEEVRSKLNRAFDERLAADMDGDCRECS